MHPLVQPTQSAYLRLLLELLDFGEEGSSVPRGRLLCEACRLLEADLLYKVTSQEGGWVKEGFDPQRERGSTSLSHVSGIVRHVLSKRARFLEARLPARGPFHRHQDGWAGVDVASYLAVPIHRKGKSRGVLVLLRGPSRPPFGIDDLSLADLLADALAVGEDVADRILDLERLARTDGATHLPNLRHLREVLARAILRAGQSEQGFSLVVIDLDLRDLASRRGLFSAADLLPRVARTLERNLRGTDVVAHYGGSTFVILLPETSVEGATCVMDRLSKMVTRDPALADCSAQEACRWGIASFPTDGVDASTLLSVAARALRPASIDAGASTPAGVEPQEGASGERAA